MAYENFLWILLILSFLLIVLVPVSVYFSVRLGWAAYYFSRDRELLRLKEIVEQDKRF